MSALRTWFAGRSLREKRLLLAMLALAVLTLVWGGIVRPVGDNLSSARTRLDDAITRQATTQAALDAVHAAGPLGAAPTGTTLADAVRARADAAGFVLASLDQPAPDRVHVTIQSARPGVLAGWLARLERSGVLVDSAALTDNHDTTVAVDLVLKARGR